MKVIKRKRRWLSRAFWYQQGFVLPDELRDIREIIFVKENKL